MKKFRTFLQGVAGGFCAFLVVGILLAATATYTDLRLSPRSASSGGTGRVRWFELIANGYNSVDLKAPDSVTSTTTYVLPDAYPTANGKLLASTTAGVMSWATDQTGGGGAGWYRPIDEPPASPDSMDDEFSGSSLDAKWTKWNEQSGQSITVGGGRATFQTPYTIQNQVYAILQPVSGTSWKFRAKAAIEAPTWNYFGVCMYVRRTTGADKTLQFTYTYNSGFAGLGPVLYRLNGTTQFAVIDLSNFDSDEVYLEAAYDGSKIKFGMSLTGHVFFVVWEETPSTHLGGDPEYIGIGLLPYSENTSSTWWGGVGVFDWFRKVA